MIIVLFNSALCWAWPQAWAGDLATKTNGRPKQREHINYIYHKGGYGRRQAAVPESYRYSTHIFSKIPLTSVNVCTCWSLIQGRHIEALGAEYLQVCGFGVGAWDRRGQLFPSVGTSIAVRRKPVHCVFLK